MNDIKYRVERTIYPSYEEENLYWDYKNELWQYEGPPVERKVVNNWYLENCMDANTTIRSIYAGDHEHIGFLILGEKGNCHWNADIYIQDTYIRPEFRRAGIMSDVVGNMLRNNRVRYSLYLLENNESAVKFWGKLFQENGYEGYYLKDYMGYETNLCKLHGFKPKETVILV